jgi:hypothetical protein
MGKHALQNYEKSSGFSYVGFTRALTSGQLTFATNGSVPMPRRRMARALGAAAGGLLGAAFLPASAAFADNYTVEPTGTETVTGLYGTGLGSADTAPPAVAGTLQGYQEFTYTDTTTGATGTFMGDESTVTDGFGDTNQEVYVTSATGTDAPPVGSVFDTYTGDTGDAYVYSAIPSAGGDAITETEVTPFGDVPVYTTFDAADVPVADASGVPLGGGYDFIPLSNTDNLISVNGIPPIDMVLQGHEHFAVDNAVGTTVGTFAGDEATTTDMAGTYTEAVLVTKDLTGTAGTAAGDVPPVGSVFNTMNLDGWVNYYSDLTSTTGGADTLTDTLVSPWGQDFSIPVTFDAAQAETPVSIADLGNGDSVAAAPGSTEIFNGVNGLPPVDVGIQGQQEFDLLSGNTVLGTFGADETKTMDLFGDVTQTLLVTSGNDALPTGSVIETVTLGSGFENVYTDIASTVAGGDVYTDTLVTPFGDIPIPVDFDLAAGLAADMFHIIP